MCVSFRCPVADNLSTTLNSGHCCHVMSRHILSIGSEVFDKAKRWLQVFWKSEDSTPGPRRFSVPTAQGITFSLLQAINSVSLSPE